MNNKARWDILIELIKKYNCKNIAEIGVESGPSSKPILTECKDLLEQYFLVDIVAHKTVNDFIFDTVGCYMKTTSEKASKLIADESLDLIFIDADHEYESVLQDIKLWSPKVKQNGIISGHDFCDSHPGVMQAVKESFCNINLEIDNERDSLVAVWWIEKNDKNIVFNKI